MPWEWDTIPYREASSRKELCNAKMFPYLGNQTILPGFKERCLNSQSDVVSFCPKKDVPSDMKYRKLTLERNKKFMPYLIKRPNLKKHTSKKRKLKKKRKRKTGKKKKGNKRKKASRHPVLAGWKKGRKKRNKKKIRKMKKKKE